MDETTAALILPFIESNLAWVNLVLGTSKGLTAVLDKAFHWENRFELKCVELQSPLARFRLMCFVECKFLKPAVYDQTISTRISVNIFMDASSSHSFARQAFPQFLRARSLLDEGFPEDDVPSATFTTQSLSQPLATSCNRISYAGDIFLHICSDSKRPLVSGDLSDLHAQLTDENEPESDDSFDCSECGTGHHIWEDVFY